MTVTGWRVVARTIALAAMAQVGSARAAEAQESGLTGSVSEAQFKAMHELKTDAPPQLRGEMVDLAGGKAYLSLPPNAKPPFAVGLVVIQEWWGLNDHVKHWADRWAAEGYAALAVDLYDGKVGTTSDEAMALMKGVDKKRLRDILLAGHAFLKADPRVQAKKRASIGWCFGGGMSLQLALAAPDLDACAMYYGRPVTDPLELERLEAPLIGIFANKDESIPPATVDKFEEALKKAEVDYELWRYDAQHAFANPSNPQYDEKAAGDAFMRVKTFFAKWLK